MTYNIWPGIMTPLLQAHITYFLFLTRALLEPFSFLPPPKRKTRLKRRASPEKHRAASGSMQRRNVKPPTAFGEWHVAGERQGAETLLEASGGVGSWAEEER
jgi:hypothetical protein